MQTALFETAELQTVPQLAIANDKNVETFNRRLREIEKLRQQKEK